MLSFPNPNSNVTFGIELEFMSPNPKPDPRDHRGFVTSRVHLAGLMAKHTSLPIACRCAHGDKEEDKCSNCDGIPADQIRDNIRVYSSVKPIGPNWDFKTNYFIFSIEYLRPFEGINGRRRWPGVELITPAFQYGELVAGLPSVGKAISGLRNIGAQITADESCGLHVHVGIESGMTQLIAKKAISLVMLLEHTLLYPLVAPSRLHSESAQPISERSNAALRRNIKSDPRLEKVTGQHRGEPMSVYMPALEEIQSGKWTHSVAPKEFYKTLQAIWDAESLQELDLLIQRSLMTRAGLAICLRNTAFELAQSWDFRNLEQSPTTLEFRYAQMSFDMTFIRNWVQLVCRIVEVAQLGAKEYKEIASKVLSTLDSKENEPVWEHLLELLSLGHQVKDWKSQLASYKTGGEIAHLDKELLLMSEAEEAKKGGKS